MKSITEVCIYDTTLCEVSIILIFSETFVYNQLYTNNQLFSIEIQSFDSHVSCDLSTSSLT